MNPSVQTRKSTNKTTTTTIQQNVSDKDEDQNIVMVGDNITFVASSKKQKINYSSKRTKELLSIISGLEFA